MTPPSTQNLKALGLWVFFLIYWSTFSFLPNVGLRLTLEYLTISPSSESPSSILIHSPLSGSKWPLTCTVIHTLIRDTLLEISIRNKIRTMKIYFRIFNEHLEYGKIIERRWNVIYRIKKTSLLCKKINYLLFKQLLMLSHNNTQPNSLANEPKIIY